MRIREAYLQALDTLLGARVQMKVLEMKDKFRVVIDYKDISGGEVSTVMLETTFLSIAIMEVKQIAMDYRLNPNQVKVLKLEDKEWVPYKFPA